MDTTTENKKKRLWLFLPLLILPFLALGFYALKSRSEGQAVSPDMAKGINTALPGAKLPKGGADDKMSLYDQAKKDSAAARSRSAAGAFAALGWDTAKFSKTAVKQANPAAANEAKIKEKLAQINRQISEPPPVVKLPVDYGASSKSVELNKLEKLLKQKQESKAPDLEMTQLNTMLDKIMQIQNPGSAKEKSAIVGVASAKDSTFKAIPAIIDGTQKVRPGGVVKLRLADSVRIGNYTFPKGQLLSGQCSVTNQRLLLEIRNIRIGTSIIPVNLTVFSLDGMAGINAPEAELGEAAGNGAGNAISGMEFMSMDQSLGTQAASAGISAAKELLGKKVKRIRVKLHGGQQVLLRNNHY
jgi:hypothetical protein